MPELPEIETIKNQLLEILPGKISHVFYYPHTSSILKMKEFDPIDMIIQNICRKGKLLYFELEKEKYILSRLGMSGSWHISGQKECEKHTHLQFKIEPIQPKIESFEQNDKNNKNDQSNPNFKNNKNTPNNPNLKNNKNNQNHQSNQTTNYYFLSYIDPRRFGRMYFTKEKEAKRIIDGLGVDVSSSAFTPSYIFNTFQKFPNKIIKSFLLEQKYFAGVGNYIANETCARSGILPFNRVGDITFKQCQRIKNSVNEVLSGAIKAGGTTFHGGYSDTTGNRGEGVKNLVVFYQKICGLCHKEAIIKIVLQGRGTYYCPRCQK